MKAAIQWGYIVYMSQFSALNFRYL